jgi:hypothetical protein
MRDRERGLHFCICEEHFIVAIECLASGECVIGATSVAYGHATAVMLCP